MMLPSSQESITILGQQYDRVFLAVFVGVILAHLSILWAQDVLPFIDLPNHLAEASIYKYYNIADHFGYYYEVGSLLNPNVLHYIFCSLFWDVEIGNKVYYSIYIILFFIAALGIINHFKGNYWFVLLAGILLYNYNVTFGFVGFSLAIPLVVLLFHQALQSGVGSVITCSLVLVLLFFTHALALLFALSFFMLLIAYRYYMYRKGLGFLLSVIPSLFLLLYWIPNSFGGNSDTPAFLIDYYSNHFLSSYFERGKFFFFDNFPLYGSWVGLALALFFSMAIIMPVVLHLLKSYQPGNGLARVNKEIGYLVIFLAASLLCYLVLPDKLTGQGILYQRFSVFVLLGMLFMGSVLYSNANASWSKIALASITFLHCALWGGYFYEFDQQNKGFQKELFSDVSPDQVLGGLIYDYEYRGRPVYIHFPSYHIVWNQGITTTKLIDFRFGTIRRRADARQLPFYHEWVGKDATFPEGYHTLEYFLLRGDEPASAKNMFHGYETVKQAEKWKILRLSK